MNRGREKQFEFPLQDSRDENAPMHETQEVHIIGLQARRMTAERTPPRNLVFLLDVSGSMSAKTGLAPSRTTQDAVAKKENGVVITSSPGAISASNAVISSAAVHEWVSNAPAAPVSEPTS